MIERQEARLHVIVEGYVQEWGFGHLCRIKLSVWESSVGYETGGREC